MKSYQGISLHTMVGSLAGTDSMFQKGGTVGTESHFGVGEHGEIYQWVDTAYTADANYLGSGHVISIETADYGGSFGRWNTSGDNVPYWNAKQIATIVKIIVWACKTHDIPIRMMANSRDRGIGYHAMGVPGNELPSKYKGTRYQWSKYPGKVCPGRKRISQVPGIVKLAQAGNTPTTPSTSPEGIFGMSVKNAGFRNGDIALPARKWKSIPLNDEGGYSLGIIGKGTSFLADTELTLKGLKPGAAVIGRFYLVSYKKGTPTRRLKGGTYPAKEIVGTAGTSLGSVMQMAKSSRTPDKGRSIRLRFEVFAGTKGVTVTKASHRFAKD